MAKDPERGLVGLAGKVFFESSEEDGILSRRVREEGDRGVKLEVVRRRENRGNGAAIDGIDEGDALVEIRAEYGVGKVGCSLFP